VTRFHRRCEFLKWVLDYKCHYLPRILCIILPDLVFVNLWNQKLVLMIKIVFPVLKFYSSKSQFKKEQTSVIRFHWRDAYFRTTEHCVSYLLLQNKLSIGQKAAWCIWIFCSESHQAKISVSQGCSSHLALEIFKHNHYFPILRLRLLHPNWLSTSRCHPHFLTFDFSCVQSMLDLSHSLSLSDLFSTNQNILLLKDPI
jgi:hypothetical protein